VDERVHDGGPLGAALNCLTGALTPPKKAKLAAALVEIVMGQEIEPMTEVGRAATPVMFNEIDANTWFPGGQPLVEHPEKPFFCRCRVLFQPTTA
jgi:phenylpyruvate tautomerase PptA (4-oxalocrotonate tautomerase family)